MTLRARFGRRLILGGALLVGLFVPVLLGSSLFHVPEGHIGAVGGRLHLPGWHFRAPFDAVRLVPASGKLDLVDVDRRTAEGAAIRVRLSFGYDLEVAPLSASADEVGRLGLAALAARVADSALQPFPASTFLPARAGALQEEHGGGRAPLPPAPREAIVGALRAAGLRPRDLEGSVGSAAAFLAPTGGAGSGNEVAVARPQPAMPSPEDTGLRLLVIGLDGADWAIIDPLVRQGRLPHLARLIAAGTRGPLRSYDPMISPLLWTTMVTGVGPDVHGVADFQAVDAASGRRVPISSRFRRVKALWNIMSDAGLDSAFVAWWASYPAEKVHGFQVSNLVAFETVRPKPAGAPAPSGLTFPPAYFDAIKRDLKTAADLRFEDVRAILRIGRGDFEAARREVLEPRTSDEEAENRRMAQRPVPLALSILTGSRNYGAIAVDLARRRLPLTAVYFEGIDMIGHRFQHCMPPRMSICPEEDFARFKDAVIAFYILQDELIGKILAAAGSGTTVMIVSDHGFKTGAGRPAGVLPFTTQQPVEWHREEGIFLLSGPGARPGQSLRAPATLFDIAPTLLYLVGLPVSDEMPGHVLVEAIEPGFAAAHPRRTLPSYERVGAAREVVASGGPGADDAEAELLANLRALGYVGDDGAGSEAAGAATSGPVAGGAGPGAGTQVFYHRNLATYLLKRKDYAGAADQLRLANERQKLPKNYQLLSEALLGMGRKDEAIAVLEEGLRTLETMDPESVLWMVRISLSDAGGRERARQAAERYAPRTSSKAGLDDAIAGLILEDEGESQAALERLRVSLLADPSRVVVAQHLFAHLGPRAGGEFLEPLLRRALAKDPRIDEYHGLLGAILAEHGRPQEALESFREAALIDPENPRFSAGAASMLARLGRWQEAAPAYERSAALAPSAGLFMQMGSVYRRLGRPEQALHAFETARALGEASAAPFLGIALARAEMHQIPEALEAARQGLAGHPEDPGLRALYDDLLRRLGAPTPAGDQAGPGR